MPISIKELRELSQLNSSARYINTNLHLHTPATRWDWNAWEGQTRKAETLTVEEYFDELNKTSLELVAVTDHNCVDWCDSLIKLARKTRKDGNSSLCILPGVEITTYEGPHLIAIFDEKKDPEEIRLMLTRLGMSGKGEIEDKVGRSGKKIPIQDVISEIVSIDGIVIGPHIGSKDGLWGFKEFRSRNDVLNNSDLKILAASSGDIKRVQDSSGKVRLLYKTMDTNIIKNSYSFINVSDCHRLEDFKTNTTWMKMSCPGLEGVRQIIYEPELRISHEIKISDKPAEYKEIFYFVEPKEASHSNIIGISMTGGMLNGLKVQFSPNQNSIIGKNYAGKSALLDCIRFSVNAIPNDENMHDKFASRMKAFIGEGGEIRLYVISKNKTYGISRVLSISRVGKGLKTKLVVDGKPEVYLLWNNEEFQHESGETAEKIFPIEVYPQGEVVKIKDNVSQQMKIVDSLCQVDNDIQDLTTESINGTLTFLGELKKNRETIINKSKRIAELKDATSEIDTLADEIKQLEALSTSDRYKEKKSWSEQEVVNNPQASWGAS